MLICPKDFERLFNVGFKGGLGSFGRSSLSWPSAWSMAARDSETLLPRNLRYRETFWVLADIVMAVVPMAFTILW